MINFVFLDSRFISNKLIPKLIYSVNLKKYLKYWTLYFNYYFSHNFFKGKLPLYISNFRLIKHFMSRDTLSVCLNSFNRKILL